MPTRRRGDENIMFDGMATGYQIGDFWEWAASDLLNNAMRGVFCEFIVAAALGLDLISCREEWTPWDLTAPHRWTDGDVLREDVRIEVKSSAYIQSWQQERPSNVIFSIRPSRFWTAEGRYSEVVRRQSDVYVFGLYAVTDREDADPAVLDGWKFYILPTRIIDSVCGDQKTISLNSLEKLSPIVTDFHGILDAIIRCSQ